jgi:energy-coupling factor transport system permease protein
MNNIALGRYLPLNTFTHHLDPRYKIMGMLFLMVTVFMPAGFIGYGIIGAFVLSRSY